MKEGQAKAPKITVVVTRSTGPLDFDAWATKYVQAVIAVDRAAQQQQAEAA
jgi:hypothetical protein